MVPIMMLVVTRLVHMLTYIQAWQIGCPRISAWVEGYSSDHIGLFEGVGGPKNAPMVVIGSESNTFNARVILKMLLGKRRYLNHLKIKRF